MKALVLSSLSGIDALSVQNMPDPTVKTGQTLVQVHAGGVNFADIMTMKGGYPGTPAPPLIALVGLLGMLGGDQLVTHLKEHLATRSQPPAASAPASSGPQTGANVRDPAPAQSDENGHR